MALPQSAINARARRDLRAAGFRPKAYGAMYDSAQGGGVNPFNPVPLRQRTKMDNLGGKIRDKTFQPNRFTPQNSQAQFAPAPQFAYRLPSQQSQSPFDPVNGGAMYLFQ